MEAEADELSSEAYAKLAGEELEIEHTSDLELPLNELVTGKVWLNSFAEQITYEVQFPCTLTRLFL